MRRHRHAKIVATIGPASSSPERLRDLFLAGADVFRLNFSHGAHDDHRKVHAAIRALEQETGRPIAILQDLQGPKIRVGLIKDGKIQVAAGDSVRFVLGREEGGREAIPLPHPEIFKAIMPGAALLDRRRPGAAGGGLARGRGDRGPGRGRRHHQQPQGRQPARHRARPLAADRQGSRGPRLRARARGRFRGALLRPEARRPDRGARADRRPGGPARQDREAAGAREDRGHRPPVRRDHGGPRRSRGRDPARGRARPAEGAGAAVPAAGQAGDRRDPDAGIDGARADADPGRGLGRRDRDL